MLIRPLTQYYHECYNINHYTNVIFPHVYSAHYVHCRRYDGKYLQQQIFVYYAVHLVDLSEETDLYGQDSSYDPLIDNVAIGTRLIGVFWQKAMPGSRQGNGFYGSSFYIEYYRCSVNVHFLKTFFFFMSFCQIYSEKICI